MMMLTLVLAIIPQQLVSCSVFPVESLRFPGLCCFVMYACIVFLFFCHYYTYNYPKTSSDLDTLLSSLTNVVWCYHRYLSSSLTNVVWCYHRYSSSSLTNVVWCYHRYSSLWALKLISKLLFRLDLGTALTMWYFLKYFFVFQFMTLKGKKNNTTKIGNIPNMTCKGI